MEIEPFEIPWLKIFTQKKIKEFSQCSNETKIAIWETLDIIEKEMLVYFKPTKINIASFGIMFLMYTFTFKLDLKMIVFFQNLHGAKDKESPV